MTRRRLIVALSAYLIAITLAFANPVTAVYAETGSEGSCGGALGDYGEGCQIGPNGCSIGFCSPTKRPCCSFNDVNPTTGHSPYCRCV